MDHSPTISFEQKYHTNTRNEYKSGMKSWITDHMHGHLARKGGEGWDSSQYNFIQLYFRLYIFYHLDDRTVENVLVISKPIILNRLICIYFLCFQQSCDASLWKRVKRWQVVRQWLHWKAHSILFQCWFPAGVAIYSSTVVASFEGSVLAPQKISFDTGKEIKSSLCTCSKILIVESQQPLLALIETYLICFSLLSLCI